MPEIRAMWVPRWDITTPEHCRRVVEVASEFGFNTLFVQVRGRGDAFYNSRFEPRAEGLASQPADFDPLAEILDAAKSYGTACHAWLNAFFVWESEKMPSAPNHIVNAHPDWLARNRDNQLSFSGSDEVEGVYACPSSEDYRAFLAGVYRDVAANYDVDGLHLDFIRCPNPDYCWCDRCLERFRASVNWSRETVDAVDRTAVCRRFSGEWDDFRRGCITEMVRAVRDAVRGAKQGLTLSAAVFPDRQDARSRRFQDWQAWARDGLVDMLCPMAYSPDTDVFSAQIRDAVDSSCGVPVCAGIGSWRIDSASTAQKITRARTLGASGFSLFSYSITEFGTRLEYLEDIRSTVAAEVD